MKLIRKFWLIAILVSLLTLTACGAQTVAEADAAATAAANGDPVADTAPEEIDPVAIFTSAAATVAAQLTETAISFSPTPEPATATVTSIPATATLVDLNQTPLPTTDGVIVEPTSTLLPGAPTITPGVPTLIPTATQGVLPTQTGPLCDAMQFVADITIPDGELVESGTNFKKIWRIKNTGTCTWDDGYILVPVHSGQVLDSPAIAHKITGQVSPGESVDVGAILSAPLASGEYSSHFSMQNDRGEYFGHWITVIINVGE